MPRERIEDLQLRKLRNLLSWTFERVPYQAERLRKAGVSGPDDVRTLADLRKLPFYTREDWIAA